MIQLNLLPDVKLEYIKAQRSKRLVLGIAILTTIVAVAILLILLGVDGLQRKHLSDLSRDITAETKSLQHQPHINQILTVQNQLESLTGLHASKPAAANTFDYLNEITPIKVSITSFSLDFTKQTITITGTADALSSVNTYVDTLKYTNYTSDTTTKSAPAFSNIVLSSFGLDASSQDKSQAASYTIDLLYDKNIFDITKKVNLIVPSETTTRSTQQSTDLFKAPATTPAAKGSN
jgi:Tfp pilus assembly protein PilN